jgi:hypothetical protein
MKILKNIQLCLFLLLPFSFIYAQGNGKMADLMRSNGKIYVVVAVMLTILLGLIFYVIRLDRKISRLEKNK